MDNPYVYTFEVISRSGDKWRMKVLADQYPTALALVAEMASRYSPRVTTIMFVEEQRVEDPMRRELHKLLYVKE